MDYIGNNVFLTCRFCNFAVEDLFDENCNVKFC